jgi:hypothetical protein
MSMKTTEDPSFWQPPEDAVAGSAGAEPDEARDRPLRVTLATPPPAAPRAGIQRFFWLWPGVVLVVVASFPPLLARFGAFTPEEAIDAVARSRRVEAGVRRGATSGLDRQAHTWSHRRGGGAGSGPGARFAAGARPNPRTRTGAPEEAVEEEPVEETEDPLLTLLYRIVGYEFSSRDEVATGRFLEDFDSQAALLASLDFELAEPYRRGKGWIKVDAPRYEIEHPDERARPEPPRYRLRVVEEDAAWKLEDVARVLQ